MAQIQDGRAMLRNRKNFLSRYPTLCVCPRGDCVFVRGLRYPLLARFRLLVGWLGQQTRQLSASDLRSIRLGPQRPEWQDCDA